MRQIAWSPKSLRAFKRMVRQNPQLRPLIEETLEQLAWKPINFPMSTIVPSSQGAIAFL